MDDNSRATLLLKRQLMELSKQANDGFRFEKINLSLKTCKLTFFGSTTSLQLVFMIFYKKWNLTPFGIFYVSTVKSYDFWVCQN